MLQRLFRGKLHRTHGCLGVYQAGVAQAREPAFYHAGVPDTPEGRFDMIALHVILIIRRCVREGGRGKAFNQALFDVMFQDMDDGLRELSVGDTVIGKRIKRLSEAFYGRAHAYGAALDAGDDGALAAALQRNLGLDAGARLDGFTGYVRACSEYLDVLMFENIISGKTIFPDVNAYISSDQ